MSTPAQRAALRALEALKDKVRTHSAPVVPEKRRLMTERQRLSRSRNGKRTGGGSPRSRLRVRAA